MENNMKKENIELGLGWFDRLLQIAEKYKIRTILKAVLILLIISASVGFVLNPHWVFEQYNKWQNKQHQEQIEWRVENNLVIQSKLDKLLYSTGANRCVIMSLHNGLNDINNVPFLRASAIFESINNTYPIGNQYQKVVLSLFPFSNHLYFNDYWYGNVEDLKSIDVNLYHKLAGNCTKHFCAVTIQGVDKKIGFLFLTFQEVPTHNCLEIRNKVQHTALELALLLELNNRKGK
jgi:hypothetical protein